MVTNNLLGPGQGARIERAMFSRIGGATKIQVKLSARRPSPVAKLCLRFSPGAAVQVTVEIS